MTTLYSWSTSADTLPDTPIGTAATVASGGTYGERITWPSTTAVANRQKTGLSITGDFGVRTIYTIASAAGSSHTILFFTDATPTVIGKVDMTSTGLLRIRNTANGTVDGTTALAYGVEHRIEAYRVSNTLTVKAYRVSDNALISSFSSAAGAVTGTVARVGFGNNAALTGTLGAFTHDELVVTDVGAEVGAPAGPLSGGTITITPATGASPLAITATVAGVVGGTGATKLYAWAWGDGTTSPANAATSVNHTYTSPGPFIATGNPDNYKYFPTCTVTNT